MWNLLILLIDSHIPKRYLAHIEQQNVSRECFVYNSALCCCSEKLPVICNCIKNELTEIELISVVGYVLQVHML